MRWFCEIEGKTSGPFTAEELGFLRSRGKLSRDDRVRSESGAWVQAGSVPEIFPVGRGPAGLVMVDVVEPSPTPVAQEPDPDQSASQIPALQTNPTADSDEEEQKEKTTLQKLMIAACIVMALLMLLLLFFLPSLTGNSSLGIPTADQTGGRTNGLDPNGGASSGESDENSGHGDQSGRDIDDGSGSGGNEPEPTEAQVGEGADESASAADQGGPTAPPKEAGDRSEGDLPPEPAPSSPGVFTVKKFTAPAPAPSAKGTGGGGGGSSVSNKPTQTLGGVKLKGTVALVCDVSGSMSSDFPVLVRELRRKFPKDTPLILVNGCHFAAPMTGGHQPIRLSDMGAQIHHRYYGVDFRKDKHVYSANSTTDAIIFAVEELNRDTVMFNNDLQDGGSRKAIQAFRELREEQSFVLSGRSLNRDAPKILHDFIRESGGEFRLDTIGRSPGPAMQWSR